MSYYNKKVSFHKDLIEFVDISKRNSLSNHSAAEIKTKKKILALSLFLHQDIKNLIFIIQN